MYCDVMRFTNDVEVNKREVNGEQRSVMNNRVAISDGAESTTYMDVVAWGGLAEVIGQYLHKGDEFYAEGTLKNKKMKIEGKEIQTVYLKIEKIKFTYGNKKKEVKDSIEA